DAQKHQHLRQSKQPEHRELLINDRPRKQENRFHIENNEQYRDHVIPDRIPLARVGIRIYSALIRQQLAFAPGIRPDELRDEQRYDRKKKRQSDKKENRNVCRQSCIIHVIPRSPMMIASKLPRHATKSAARPADILARL